MKLSSFDCLTALWALVGQVYASPPIRVQLRSSWPAPNLFIEVLESASVEQHDTFFHLLDLLTSPEVFPQPLASLTPEAIHDASVQTLVKNGYLSEPGALESFELSLSLHAASPKIEAYYQYFRDHRLAETPLVDEELTDDCTGSWVEWYGRRVCSVDTLRHLVEVDTLDAGNDTNRSVCVDTKLLSFEHVYPPTSGVLYPPKKTAILYGDTTSNNFRNLHDYIYALSKENPPRLQYIYRHIPPNDEGAGPSHLSGYGVTLDLKKMDYLALDDRRHSRRSVHTTSTNNKSSNGEQDSGEVTDLLGFLEETDEVDLTTPLNEEEISGIGIKAAQLVMNSPDPLKALMHLSQNFPKYATSTARRVAVDPPLLEELQRNWVKAQQGSNAVWLNGLALQITDVNTFGLLRLLRKERELVGQMKTLGLTAPQGIDLLTHEAIISSQTETRVIDGIFDASDRLEGGVIVWWNDLEKDKRYAQWSPTLHMMLRPIYPGQFHNVKRNLYNTVLLLDLSQRSSLVWITGPISNIVQRGFPFRFGVVPLIETDEGRKAAQLFFYLIETYGRSETMNFLKKACFQRPNGPSQNRHTTLDFEIARAEFQALIENNAASPPEREEQDKVYLTFEEVIGTSTLNSTSSPDLTATIEKARRYAKRLGATLKSSPQGHAFINGKHANIAEDFLNTLQIEISQQTQYLQEQIYGGKLTDDMDTSMHFYDLPTTAVKRNRYIYPTTQAGSLKVVNMLEAFARTQLQPGLFDFVYPASNPYPPVSICIIADFDKPSGNLLLKGALTSMASDSLSSYLAWMHNASVLNHTTPMELLIALDQWGKKEGEKVSIAEHLQAVSPNNGDTTEALYAHFSKSGRLLAREFGIEPGEQALIVNGRVVGPIEEEEFTAEDFENLADYEISRRVGPVIKAYANITGRETTGSEFSDNISMLSSVISAVQIPDPLAEGLFNIPQRPRNRAYRLLDQTHLCFEFGDNTTASYQFAFILDPVSELASRWTPLITWLAELDSVYVQVHLNPVASLPELPLKQFYRFTMPSRLTFDESGSEGLSTVEFKELPPDPIYTLGMDVPPAWLVRPHDSHHDLDNIRLASFTGMDRVAGVEAIFHLDYLVVEGHARDTNTNAPPRGLQLQLTTSNSTPIADTQVVANLGYLQFKAKPGVFQLEIRDGYGRDVFELDSVGNEGWNSPPVTSGLDITLTSLEGLTLYPRVHKRPGMESADVLAEPFNHGTPGIVEQVVSSISSMFWPKKQVAVTTDQATINIFTVASGLLYERFVSIMILSVLRNTKSSVKFWFIENFLSPSFLEFIPHLAEAYNFQYELVTYKWPSWLRAQTEKQRIIWGYKILFLDVLFPMDLKKVIFVDADQIVRADLKELVDLDLNGAPYGYTPMGDDNTDMEGFRFWKTGYWKDFLRGRPYHISALYVIDLVRFRQLAAGDRLRGSYQTLSADPNSLSNLDQDLPNNLQFEVPIFSLPEDWLWCETWCTKDRLHRAKTIDLCQNPLTKEPKLARARQIPEWEEYDTEISQFARKLADEGVIRSAAYAGGADSLANFGATGSSEKSVEADKSEADESETAGDPKRRDEL
ncbi:glycosyltransferase family 24 protein [Ramaria rubella]|nr:glycosyltransferase family 24 protein [Ramaria rubella]